VSTRRRIEATLQMSDFWAFMQVGTTIFLAVWVLFLFGLWVESKL